MLKLSLAVVAVVLAVGCGKDDPPAPAPSPTNESKLSRPSELPRPPAGKLPDDLKPPR
jgi:hypothetical protein